MDLTQHPTTTHANPVYQGYFADPFVLEFIGRYHAYGTGGLVENGRVIEVLESSDLVTWRSLGPSLEVLSHGPLEYWAPEVAFDGERFFIYAGSSLRATPFKYRPSSGFAQRSINVEMLD